MFNYFSTINIYMAFYVPISKKSTRNIFQFIDGVILNE